MRTLTEIEAELNKWFEAYEDGRISLSEWNNKLAWLDAEYSNVYEASPA